jgi:enoyl-CoA hydratase/carnithine racemase
MALVELEKKGPIAWITLNRPQALNAFTQAMWRELEDVWADFLADDALRVGVVTGAGERAFSAGADMKEMASREQPHDGVKRIKVMEDGDIDVWKPLVAAVNGHAYGAGMSLACACDVRLCSENATFAMSQVRWGIASGTGTQWLPKVLPATVAMEMLLTGRPIDAQRALAVGFVSRVVPLGELPAAAEEMARAIAENPPVAVYLAKKAARAGWSLRIESALQMGYQLEQESYRSGEGIEGPRAFAEKRRPEYGGNS